MFEQLIEKPTVLERYRNAPLASERVRFLQHFQAEGHSHSRLTAANVLLMALAINADWRMGKMSTMDIEAAADKWLASRLRRHKTARSARGMKRDFISIGTQFLRSVNRFTEPEVAVPFQAETEAFLRFLDEERGLAAYTVDLRQRSLRHFLTWLADQVGSVGDVTPCTITQYFSIDRAWCRATVKFHANTLRAFFRFAADKGWCEPNLASTISSPRIFSFESLPQGLKWPDVQRLIGGLSGPSPAEIRDRAVIMLLSVYGLRMHEVLQLTLDDLDWGGERLNVTRSKQRKRQQFPLCADVGDAIVRYLREVRPSSTHRELFLTLRMPHRPYGRCGFSNAIAARLKGLGIPLTHYGPHVLRHACATHLLAQGFSMKEIGDHLGHRSTQATRIYAKVDVRSLREVADLHLPDLAANVSIAESLGPRDVPPDKLAALRELANLGIGGVA